MSGQSQLQPLYAHEKALRAVFSDEYAFEIPVYQRPYAWEREQVKDLLNDLLEAMDEDDQPSYFLGSIVLVKERNKAECDVIDGQQRLTTLTILLSVLRDLTTDKDVFINRRSYVYQKANADEGAESKYRLKTRKKDRDFFRKHIQDDLATAQLPSPKEVSGARLRMVENASYFRSVLGVKGEDVRNRLMNFLMTKCYLVSVEVPDEDAARRIFVVMNSRGLDLSPTDILKAKLLRRYDEDEELEALVAERWEAVENALGRDLFADLFGHIRMLHERDKPRTSLEKGFVEHVAPFSHDDDFVSNVLEPTAEKLQLIMNVKRMRLRFGPVAAQAIAAILKVDNKDWIPPLLRKLEISSNDEDVVAFLLKLERLVYQLFVTRADINTRIGRYVGVLNEMDPQPPRSNRKVTRRARVASRFGLDLTEDDRLAFLEGLNGDIYLKARVCRPLLERLDGLLASDGGTYESLSVEHVLPQTVRAGSEWMKHFPDEAVREEWTHKLGNLVLLSTRINAKASNWGFEQKKREYFVSKDGRTPFPVTQGVLEVPEWNLAAIQRMQHKYLRKFSDHWGLGYQ